MYDFYQNEQTNINNLNLKAMRKFYVLFFLAVLTISVNAQFVYTDFDNNQNVTFSGWPNAPVTISNPDPSGNNTSPNVGEWVRTTEQWAHTSCVLDGKIDFSTVQQFSLKVWSPIACNVLFKLEDKLNGAIFVEVSQSITNANQWEQLSFDFTGAASGTYDKIVIFFDFSSNIDNTFYFDDVEGPGYSGSGVKPLLELDVQDNFEDNGWATIDQWFFQDPGLTPLVVTNDPVSTDNHVADYARSGSFEWTNAQFILHHRMDLSERNVFDLMVYFPSSNDYTGSLTPTAAIKLQNSLLGPNAWTTQTEVKLNVSAYDEWVTLAFDFSAVEDSINYDQVVVQLGGEGHFVSAQFYFDDLHLQISSFLGEQKTEKLVCFPNPATDRLHFPGLHRISDVRIYDMAGNSTAIKYDNGSSLDVSGLSNGLYVVRVIDEKGMIYSSQFIKQ